MKKTTYILSFFLLLTSCGKDENALLIEEVLFPCSSEVSIDAIDHSKYGSIPDDCLFVVLEDDFSNNDFNWNQTMDNNINYETINGVYSMEVISNFYYHSFNDFDDMSSLTNYIIDVDVKILGTNQTKPAALIWGGKDRLDNLYRFSFAKSGKVEIQKRENGQNADAIMDSFTVNNIRPAGFNKLSVKVIGAFNYLFINEVHVATLAIDLFGHEIGFAVGSFSEAEFDNLKVRAIRNF